MVRKILASELFAPMFALLQTLRHVGMHAYSYWSASHYEKNFDAWDFIHRDLARPLFEPFGFCDGWMSYAPVQSAVLGLDLPIYLTATILHSVMTNQESCTHALMTPRGHIITAALALPIWFLAGLGIRRLGLRQWRPPVSSNLLRYVLHVILLSGILGGLLLALATLTLMVSSLGSAVHLLGFGLWLVWLGILSAERLRVWPFAKLFPAEHSR